MRSVYEKPLYDAEKSTDENLIRLHEVLAAVIEQINRENTTRAADVVYSGNTTSGTATVPLGTGMHTVFLAVIGGVPVLAACHDGKIAAAGGDGTKTVSLSATVKGETMTFSASGTLDKLILIL